MAEFVLAARRQFRKQGLPEHAVAAVQARVVGGVQDPDRLIVELSPAVAEELQRRFGTRLIIEPVIQHHRLARA